MWNEVQSMTDFARLVAPYARRLSNMVARGSVSLVNAATKMQSLQLRLLAGESKDDVEHFEPYGLTSHPQPGAECVALFLDGDRSHGVVVCVADRRYRVKGLASGEVILHDDQGQSVYLMRGGIKLTDKAGSTVVMQGDGSGSMTFAAGLTINANSKIVGTLEVTQNITSDASITAAQDVGDQGGVKTMAGMREIYNRHTHAGTDSHGDGFTTNPPNQQE
jgi:phage baseplate assembly protein V